MLQHRGQDAAGIVTEDEGVLHQCKGEGLVRDVFRRSHMMRLVVGKYWYRPCSLSHSGQFRSGTGSAPLVNSPTVFFIAHNGNLTNADELREHIFRTDLRHLNKIPTRGAAQCLCRKAPRPRQAGADGEDNVFAAVEQVHQRFYGGAYAVVGLIANYGMFAFRDPHGIRPLCYGKRVTDSGVEYAVVSESVVLDN